MFNTLSKNKKIPAIYSMIPHPKKFKKGALPTLKFISQRNKVYLKYFLVINILSIDDLQLYQNTVV